MHIVIIDNGLCNVDSIARAVDKCGGSSILTRDPRDVRRADKIVLPGVGSFPAAMRNLRRDGLADALCERVAQGNVPLLGICLGMQLLATEGTEVESCAGLGLVPGAIRRLEARGSAYRIPHVGWNEVRVRAETPLLSGIDPASDFYFVHSFAMKCDDPADVMATTPYGEDFVAVIQRGNIFGTQFHPEKSQRAGLRLLRNFLAL